MTEQYRSFFFDLDQFAHLVSHWASAAKILEVGCGEGALTERLVRIYPDAHVTGIDLTPAVGRLFRGDRQRVTFLQQPICEFASAHQQKFDLAVVCDVMHHVPPEVHYDLLLHTKQTLRTGGRFVLKDWENANNLVNVLAFLSDRFITGDRIRYRTRDYFQRLVRRVFGAESIERLDRLRPWPNNIAFFVRA